MSRRTIPIAVFLLLAGGLTVAWLLQPAPPPPPGAGGPLVRLSPHLRRLEDGPDGEITARSFVDATLDGLEGSPRASILEALSSEDWGAQWAGLLAIAEYGPPDAVLARALGPLLSAAAVRVRRLAARSCAFLGAELPSVEPGLERAARDDDAEVRAQALATLAQRSARVSQLWTLFATALGDEHPDVRAAGAKGLARIELQEVLMPRHLDPLRKTLGAALADDTHDVRMYAVMALGRMGPRAASEIEGIVALLDDPSTLVRGTAANALGEVGTAALPAIEQALKDAPAARASSLLWALKVIGPPALPLLRRTLDAPDPTLKVQVAMKLWELSEPPEASARVLAGALAGQDDDARRLAARGFARMGTAGATERSVLARFRDDEDAVVRDAVRSALVRIDAAARKAEK